MSTNFPTRMDPMPEAPANDYSLNTRFKRMIEQGLERVPEDQRTDKYDGCSMVAWMRVRFEPMDEIKAYGILIQLGETAFPRALADILSRREGPLNRVALVAMANLALRSEYPTQAEREARLLDMFKPYYEQKDRPFSVWASDCFLYPPSNRYPKSDEITRMLGRVSLEEDPNNDWFVDLEENWHLWRKFLAYSFLSWSAASLKIISNRNRNGSIEDTFWGHAHNILPDIEERASASEYASLYKRKAKLIQEELITLGEARNRNVHPYTVPVSISNIF